MNVANMVCVPANKRSLGDNATLFFEYANDPETSEVAVSDDSIVVPYTIDAKIL